MTSNGHPLGSSSSSSTLFFNAPNVIVEGEGHGPSHTSPPVTSATALAPTPVPPRRLVLNFKPRSTEAAQQATSPSSLPVNPAASTTERGGAATQDSTNSNSHGFGTMDARRPLRLKVSSSLSLPAPPISSPASAAAAVAVDGGHWWTELRRIDEHSLFTSLPLFQQTLPTCGSVNAFYAGMVKAFDEWRRDQWSALVLSHDPIFAKAKHSSSTSAAAALSKAERLEKQRAYVVAGQTRWLESVRVERLMAQQLLTHNMNHASVCGQGRGNRNEDDLWLDEWSFEEACPEAMAAALDLEAGATVEYTRVRHRPTSTSSLASTRTGFDEVKATVLSAKQMGFHTGATVTACVPSRSRLLLLLRVVDQLWAYPPRDVATAAAPGVDPYPFRLPVTEWEAPGYHKRVKAAVCLAFLYVDILRGVTENTRHQHQLRLKRKAVAVGLHPSLTPHQQQQQQQYSVNKDAFVNYSQLRELLMLLRTNCTTYNGTGSVLDVQADTLVSHGMRLLRDAQAVEENDAAASAGGYSTGEVNVNGEGVDGAAWVPTSLTELEALLPPSSKSSLTPREATLAAAPAPKRMVLNLSGGKTASIKVATEQPSPGEKPRKKRGRIPDRKEKQSVEHAVTPASGEGAGDGAQQTFWVCCDRCETWRVLPAKLDPPPVYWVCSYMGEVCDDEKVAAAAKRHAKRLKGTIVKASSTGGARGRARHGKARNTEVRSAAPGAAAGAEEDEDDIPIARQFFGTLREVKAARKQNKKAVLQSRKNSTATAKRRKANASKMPAHPASHPVVHDSLKGEEEQSSTTSSSSSSSDDDDSSCSESFSSSSSSDVSSESSASHRRNKKKKKKKSPAALSSGAKARGKKDGLKRRRSPAAKQNTKKRNKRRRSVNSSSASSSSASDNDHSGREGRGGGGGAHASRFNLHELEKLEEELEELEDRALDDNPLELLQKLKNLDKKLR